jgi:hypothetical protein
MKNKFSVLGMLAAALALGFVFTGCDNGTGGTTEDTAAPALSRQVVAEYTSTVAGTTATVVFYSNEAGSYYVQVLGSTAAAPTVSELATSGITGVVTANTATMVPITGLTNGLEYKVYVTVKDAAGNYSAVWSSDDAFTPPQRENDTDPGIGTWIKDNPGQVPGIPDVNFDEIKLTIDDSTWAIVFTISSANMINVPVSSGTYIFSGYPAIWAVTEVDPTYSTELKAGDTGIAAIGTDEKMSVFNFAAPIANGTYSKQL